MAMLNIGLSFNSTLVRLKLWKCLRCIFLDNEFQFHTGSIKAPAGCQPAEVFVQFQFHTGSIKAMLIYNDIAKKFNVSIPHWFD